MTTHPEQARGLHVIGRSDLGGHGDGMQVLRHEDALYVAHFGPSGMGTTVLDVSDPSTPRPVRQWRAPEGSHTHKVQVADGLLLVNVEQFRGGEPFTGGLVVYDLADPAEPCIAAHWQPDAPAGQAAPQTNDLYVETNGRVWVTDRVGGGLDVLEPEIGRAHV